MQRIAVALIDALGFKGIWKRVEEPRLIGALRRYRELAGRMTSNVGQWPSPVKFHAQSISDSLLFATAADEHTRELDQRMIELLGATVSATLRGALLSDMPLAFRGHLTLGDGLLEDGLLVGEAVDAAAENYERADAACVWLCPTASEVVDSIDPKKVAGNWIRADIPLVTSKLKDGEASPVRAVAINPCGVTPVRRQHEELIVKMHAAFDSGQDPTSARVVRKRDNSIRFLEECSAAAKNWYESHGFPNAKNC